MAAPITAHCICLSRWLNLIRKNDRIGQTFVRINNDKCFIRCLNTGQKHLAKHPANSLQGIQSAAIPVDKLKVTYSRSSGPGGQHVNKVNTKAEVRFHVHTAEWIPEEVRNEIMLKSKTRINKAGELIITSEVSRSQQQNLEDCLQKISEIISEASQRPPEPTEEDIALRAKRLQKRNTIRLKDKKSHSATKQARQVFD